MNSTSHKQARAWIDEQANNSLTTSNNELLQAHLSTCAECSAYAAEIQGLEKSLGDSFNERWGEPSLSPQDVGNLVTNVQESISLGGKEMSEPYVNGGNKLQSLFKNPYVWGAALAVVALAVASYFYFGNSDDPIMPSPDSGPELPEQLPESQDFPGLPPCTFSSPYSFSPPVRVYPANNDLVLDLQPEFDWTFGLECVPMDYQVSVMTEKSAEGGNTWATPDVFKGDIGSLKTTFSEITLAPATWHLWLVCARINPGAANCDFNPVHFLTGPICGPGELVPPTLIYPADGSIYTGKSWGNAYEVETDIAYPSGICIPDGFEIYISETADFSTPNLNVYPWAGISSTNSEGWLIAEDDSNDVPDCTQLYWKAWASVDGVDGPESEVFSFYTDIEGTCFIPFQFKDVIYVQLPQNANCRASDGADSRNIATLYEGEQLAMLAINPEGTHVRVMESKFDVKCWAWLGVVDLMKGNEIIDPSIVLELGPIVDPVEPPVEEPADEPAEEADEPVEEADEPADEPDDDPTEEPAQCSDGIDNDGDGAIDYGDTAAIASGKADRECSSRGDNDEAN